MYAAWF